jgi:hypothetical protein
VFKLNGKAKSSPAIHCTVGSATLRFFHEAVGYQFRVATCLEKSQFSFVRGVDVSQRIMLLF